MEFMIATIILLNHCYCSGASLRGRFARSNPTENFLGDCFAPERARNDDAL